MQKSLKTSSLWLLSNALLLGLFGVTLAQARLLDKVASVVGREVILLSDLQRFRTDAEKANLLQLSGQMDPKALQKDSFVLDLMLKDKLLEQAVKRLQLTATEEEIEVTINRIQKQNQIDRNQLRETLKTQGISYDTFRENVRKQIEKQNLIQKEIRQKVQITEQDLYSHYLNNFREAENSSAEYRFSHILLTNATFGGKEKTLALAKKIVADLRGGADFAKLAEKYSEDRASRLAGGDLGYFRQGVLDAALERALRKLKPNEISSPVSSGKTVQILLLTDRRVQKDAGFEKHKEQIRQVLQQQEFSRQLELWFTNEREQAHVRTLL